MPVRRSLRFFIAAASLVCSTALADRSGPATMGPDAVVFQGRLVDTEGDPLRAARISVYEEGRDSRAAATTGSDSSGRFVLHLPPGRYLLQVGLENFRDLNESVILSAGPQTSRDFVMQLGVEETVTVHAQSGYIVPVISSGTRTSTPLRDVPQAITVVTRELMQDQLMTSIGDVVRYVPGAALHQGENNRDQIIMRGNSSSADFFVDGIRDDVQYYRDLYNLERVEALKGPNSLIFGRGGAGGVINRVTKEAGFAPLREISLQGGDHGHKRISADLDQAVGERLAFRLNGIYEDSGSFRGNGLGITRSGIAPSLTYLMSDATKITVNYEHFRDDRIADRGITSYLGSPADVPIDTFYGNPADSHVRAAVQLATASIDHRIGQLSIRNRTLFGDYDRSYQNYVPGQVTTDKSHVALSAYNNTTNRQNIFNQTDLVWGRKVGAVKHTLLAGVEIGRQLTDNFRNTGFFNNTSTSLLAPYGDPTISTPVTFRQSATDADNHLRTNLGALFVQDQLEVGPRVRLIGGLRFDRFDLTYHNNRNGESIARIDNLISPRAGIVIKPAAAVSLYGSYSVSHLPSSGDQFSSLTSITRQLEPEKFNNLEAGLKWDASSALSLSAAIYRLDRTNTRSTDPNDPTRIVQTGSQRTNGFEIGVNGRITPAWSVAGGYSWQDAFVTSATTAALSGAVVGQVPNHTLSLWNNVQLNQRVAAAVGTVYRSKMFATIDNSVTLPGYLRFDAAAYYNLTSDLRLQVNVENITNERYWANADSNTNLSPGSPRAVRLGVVARF